jgi:hypothetical protein
MASKLKKQKSVEDRLNFASGLNVVMQRVLDDYVIPEKREECRQYLSTEFGKVPYFSNSSFIKNFHEATKLNNQHQKMNAKETEVEKIKNTIEACLVDRNLVYFGDQDVNFVPSELIDAYFTKLTQIELRIKHSQADILYYRVQTGGYLNGIKQKCDGTTLDFAKLLNYRKVEYSMSMVYFFIDLYNFAVEFPKIQHCNLSLNFVKSKFKTIKEIIRSNPDKWNHL